MKNIYRLSSIFIAVVFLLLALGSDDSDTPPKDKMHKDLKDVRIIGNTASFTYNVGKGTLLAQMFHESNMLDKVYWLITKKNVKSINIIIHDYCEDKYGHSNKRTFKVVLDESWYYWREAFKYADVNSFSDKLGQRYPIGNEIDWACCGRDRSCAYH